MPDSERKVPLSQTSRDAAVSRLVFLGAESISGRASSKKGSRGITNTRVREGGEVWRSSSFFPSSFLMIMGYFYRQKKQERPESLCVGEIPAFIGPRWAADFLNGGGGGNRTPVRKCFRGDFSGRRESFLFPRPSVDAHTHGVGSFIVHGALKALRTHVRR